MPHFAGAAARGFSSRHRHIVQKISAIGYAGPPVFEHYARPVRKGKTYRSHFESRFFASLI